MAYKIDVIVKDPKDIEVKGTPSYETEVTQRGLVKEVRIRSLDPFTVEVNEPGGKREVPGKPV